MQNNLKILLKCSCKSSVNHGAVGGLRVLVEAGS